MILYIVYSQCFEISSRSSLRRGALLFLEPCNSSYCTRVLLIVTRKKKHCFNSFLFCSRVWLSPLWRFVGLHVRYCWRYTHCCRDVNQTGMLHSNQLARRLASCPKVSGANFCSCNHSFQGFFFFCFFIIFTICCFWKMKMLYDSDKCGCCKNLFFHKTNPAP